ncbi:MAG TPA: haloacid dehalogenase, partial [Planctomycetaceae bacterium]|nr:haloacid dehalogenase [Planctomycetaceae bacterium]
MRYLFLLLLLFVTQVVSAADPLPSWNDGPAKDAILNFVKCATNDGCPLYVPPKDRIAVFDNDGTLWSEQPAYFQLLFALDRVKALADQHPEWKNEQPFKAILENDLKAAAASGKDGLLKIMAVTHSGMTTDEFEETVRNWIRTA